MKDNDTLTISAEEASILVDEFDNLPVEEQVKAQNVISRYLSQEEAAGRTPFEETAEVQQSRAARVNNVFTDWDGYVEGLGDQKTLFLESMESPEDKTFYSNALFLALHYGKDFGQVVDDYSLYRNDYAGRKGLKGDYTDEDVYNLMKEDIDYENVQREEASKLLSMAVTDAMDGSKTWLDSFMEAQLQMTNSENYRPEMADFYAEAFRDTFENSKRNFQTVGGLVNRTLDLGKAATEGGDKDEGINVKNLDEPGDLLYEWLQLPPDQLESALFLLSQKVQEGAEGDTEGSTVEALLRGINDIVRRNVAGIDRMKRRALRSEIERGGAISMRERDRTLFEFGGRMGQYEGLLSSATIMGDGPMDPEYRAELAGSRLATQEDKERLLEALDVMDEADVLSRKLQSMLMAEDPIKGENIMGIPGTDFVQNKIWFPFLENLAFTGQAFVPFAGLPLLINSSADIRFEEYMAKNPELDFQTAHTMSLVSGTLEAPIEQIQARLLLGKSGILGGMLKRGSGGFSQVVSSFIKHVGIQVAEQNFQEALQDFTPILVKEIAEGLDTVQQKEDFLDLTKDWASERPDVFFALLPMALIGAGGATFRDSQALHQMAADTDALRMIGVPRERAEKIARMKDPKAKEKELRAALEERDVELGKRIRAEFIEAQNQRAEQRQNRSTAKVQASGGQWFVTTPDQTRIIAQVSSYEKAQEIAEEWDQQEWDRDIRAARERYIHLIENALDSNQYLLNLPTTDRFLADDVAKGILTEEEAIELLRRANQNWDEKTREAGKDAVLSQITIGGTNRMMTMDGVRASVSIIYKEGRLDDVWEEVSEGYLKLSVENGRWTREDFLGWKHKWEETHKKTHGDENLVEWWSEIAKGYALGRFMTDLRKILPKPVLDFLDMAVTFMANTVEIAAELQALKAIGKLDKDFETALAEATAIQTPQTRADAGAEKAKEEIPSYSMKPIEGISQASDEYDGSRVGTSFQGTDAKPRPTGQDDNIDTEKVPEKTRKAQIEKIKGPHYSHVPEDIQNEKDWKLKERKMITWMKDNLLALYRAVPEEIRIRSTHWYDGGRAIADNFADRFSITAEQAAAVIANLSPQKDWYRNVAQAEQVIDIWVNHRTDLITEALIRVQLEEIINSADVPAAHKEKASPAEKKQPGETPDQKKARQKITEARRARNNKLTQGAIDKRRAKLEPIIGQTIESIADPEIQAWAIIAMARSIYGRKYNVIAPEGYPMGLVYKKGTKSPAKNGWGSTEEVTKCVECLIDGSIENISAGLREQHKVRSFFNNIIAPNSPYGDATIDTHAVAAAHLMPYGASAEAVQHNFGTRMTSPEGISGNYHLYLSAYREAAAEVELLPRQMQSITWETIRGLIPPENRRDANVIAKSKENWQIDGYDQSRAAFLREGIPPPPWAGADDGGQFGPNSETPGLAGATRVFGGNLVFAGSRAPVGESGLRSDAGRLNPGALPGRLRRRFKPIGVSYSLRAEQAKRERLARKEADDAFLKKAAAYFSAPGYLEARNADIAKMDPRNVTGTGVKYKQRPRDKRDKDWKFTYSLRANLDKRYLYLVNEGDEKGAQELVDIYARERGATSPLVYHGSADAFDVFDKKMLGFSTMAYGAHKGFFFTESKEDAEGFARSAAWRRGKDTMEKYPHGITRKFYLMGKGYEVSGYNPNDYEAWRYIPLDADYVKFTGVRDTIDAASSADGIMIDGEKLLGLDANGTLPEVIMNDEFWSDEEEKVVNHEKLADDLAIAMKELLDNGDYENMDDLEQNGAGIVQLWEAARDGKEIKEWIAPTVTVYAVFNPEFIKSADPVTFDQDGNVIPLSKRFDILDERVSYSLRGPAKITAAGRVTPLRKHLGFEGAKYHGNAQDALAVVRDLWTDREMDSLRQVLDPERSALIVPVLAREGTSTNALPIALAAYIEDKLNIPIHKDLFKTSSAHNTDADGKTRARTQHVWEGIPAEADQIILVDDTFTTGQTLKSMLPYVKGKIVAIATLARSRSGTRWADDSSLPRLLDKAGITKAEYDRDYEIPLTGAQIAKYLWNGEAGREGLNAFYPPTRDGGHSEYFTSSYSLRPKGLTYFSGVGMVEIGLKGTVEPTHAVEYSPAIAQAYRAAHGDHVRAEDIRDVDPADFEGVQHFHASPVCKNFSLLKSAAKGGGESNLDIESAEAVVRAIKKLQPRFVTIENVPGYRGTEASNMILDALSDNGYAYDEGVYNAHDYGAPTTRQRYLVRASKDARDLVPPEPVQGPDWYSTIEDMIEDLPDVSIERAQFMQDYLRSKGIDPYNVEEPLLVAGAGVFKRLSISRPGDPAFTFKASPSVLDRILLPGGRAKRVTARAKARMSGIPDSFPLPDDEKVAGTVIGNGVPPDLVRNVFGPMLRSATIEGTSFSLRAKEGLKKAGMTAISRKETSTTVRGIPEDLVQGRVLHQGAGVPGNPDRASLESMAKEVVHYDPTHSPETEDLLEQGDFDAVVSPFVVNVVPPRWRKFVYLAAGKSLKPGGHAIFSARGDVAKAAEKSGGTWTPEGDGWMTSTGTFQRNYTREELRKEALKYFEEVEILKTKDGNHFPIGAPVVIARNPRVSYSLRPARSPRPRLQLQPRAEGEEIETKEQERKISERVLTGDHDGSTYAGETRNRIRNTLYETLPNKATVNSVLDIIEKEGVTKANSLYYTSTGMHPAIRHALGMALSQIYDAAGNYEAAADILDDLAERATQAGQAVQIFSIFGAVLDTPGKAVAYYRRQIDKVTQNVMLRPEVQVTREEAESVFDRANELFNVWIRQIIGAPKKSAGHANIADLPDISFSLRPELVPVVPPAAEILKEYGPEELDRILEEKYGPKIRKHLADIKIEAVKLLQGSKGIKTPKPAKKPSQGRDTGFGRANPEARAAVNMDGFSDFLKSQVKARIRARNIETPRQARNAVDKLVELYDEGNLNEGDIDRVFAEVYKVPEITEQDTAVLADFAKRIARTPPNSVTRRTATVAMMDWIHDKLGEVDVVDILWSIWYANILSGYNTHIRNVGDTGLQVLADLTLDALQLNPFQTIENLRILLVDTTKAADLAWDEAFRHVKSGEEILGRETVSKFGARSVLERITFKLGALNPYNYLKFVGRLLVAEDSFWFHTAQEVKARMVASQRARAVGKTTEEREKIVQALLASAEEQIADFQARAENEWDKMQPGDTTDSRGQWIERRVLELQQMSRDGELIEQASDFAARATYNYKPEGILGVVGEYLGMALHGPSNSQSIKKALEHSNPAYRLGVKAALGWPRLLMPFVRIVINVTNKGLDYTPVGIARSMVSWSMRASKGGNDVIETVSKGADLRARELKKGIFGTAVVVAAMLRDPEDDDVFKIHGSGPLDFNKARQLRGTGWMPYSIQIGSAYVSYRNTPLVAVLGWIGSIHDKRRYAPEDLEDEEFITRMAYSFTALGQLTLDASFLVNMADMFMVLQRGDEESATRGLTRMFTRMADPSTMVPASNLLRQLNEDLDPELRDRNGIAASMLSRVPVGSFYNKPALDLLGEPIDNRPLDWIWGVEKDPDSDSSVRIWRMIADKQAFITNTWQYRKPMGDEMFYEFTKVRGALIREALLERGGRLLSRMEGMAPEDAQDEMQKISRKATATAREMVNFNPDKK